MKRRWIILGLLLALILVHQPVLRALGHLLITDEPPQPSDAVVVLAGGSDGERILKSGELVRQGLAPVAFMSGPALLYERTECELAIPYAVRRGYPESYFQCIVNQASNTRDEARQVAAELRRRGVRRFLLVTSEFHTARASRVYHDVAPDLSFRTIAARSPSFDIDQWWKSRDGFKNVYMEWSKTIAYRLGF